MEFFCKTQALTTAIMNVALAVAPKSGLSALEGILVVAKNSTVTLTGYNLELGITTEIDAEVTHSGEIVIPSKLLSDIVRKTDSENITIKTNDRFMVEINGGCSHFTILGMSALEFPELPAMSDVSNVSINQNTLRSMINQTLFSISTSDAKPIHTGALFVIEDGTVTVVAVDGFRLALRREKANINKNLRFIVPGKSLSELLKLLNEDEDISIEIAKKHIMFRIKDCCVISRLLEGDFLDYNAAIPKDCSTTVTVSTRALISSIERTSLLISEKLKNPLRVNFGEESICMSCSTAIGKASDECVASLEGKTLEMGFNNKYLMDALKNSDTDIVCLQMNGPLSPMKVVPIDGDSFLFLVLPMRLKSE